MFSKYSLLLYFLTNVDCKSFTIVLDTTGSMQEEIDIIKGNIASVVGSINVADYKNYILVPFNDPDVGAPIISTTAEGLMTSLGTMKTSGGMECPENSLAGIEKALRVSDPGSSILVFTDAYAKQYGDLSSILDLCRKKFNQVLIFLSGKCLATSRTPKGDLGVYYDVTRVCSGSVFRLESASNLRQAFRVIKDVLNTDRNEVTGFETFSTQKEFTFRREALTKDMILVVSGEQPQLQITNQNVQGPSIEKIIDTRNLQMVRLSGSEVGQFVVTVTCQGTTSITLYRKTELPYQYGFSTVLPRSILETSPTPMPGRINYILIYVLKTSIECRSLEIFDGFSTREVKVEATDKRQLYIAKTFIEPDRIFRITVKGQDSYEEISCSTAPLAPQALVENVTWTEPTSSIIEPDDKLVDYGANLVIACKVNGYPKPKIEWVDSSDQELLSNEVLLEIPSTYISYATIENVIANMTVYCKCENSLGAGSQSMSIFVNRTYTFEVVQTPFDQTVEYGSEGKLFCQINAYPEASYKWYHNDTLVEPSDSIELVAEDFALYLKNMSLEDVGSYTCEVENIADKKTFSATVHISGIEAPQVSKKTDEIILKPGDWTNLECPLAKGTPTPQVTWTYKSEYGFDFEALPEGVFEESGKLKIPSIQKEHKGVYRCTAMNSLGEDFSEITIRIRYSPMIKNTGMESMTVREGDDVELSCDVTASPKATVRWEMSQDDVIIPFNNRHVTDFSNTHRFNALGNDSGNYHCIAENNIGRAEITVKINVLVAPYIEPAKLKHITATRGTNVSLPCNVLFGNPAPSLKWEFLSTDFKSTLLKKGNSANVLEIMNVSTLNEGTYLCIAENDIGSDTIKYYVKLQ